MVLLSLLTCHFLWKNDTGAATQMTTSYINANNSELVILDFWEKQLLITDYVLKLSYGLVTFCDNIFFFSTVCTSLSLLTIWYIMMTKICLIWNILFGIRTWQLYSSNDIYFRIARICWPYKRNTFICCSFLFSLV